MQKKLFTLSKICVILDSEISKERIMETYTRRTLKMAISRLSSSIILLASLVDLDIDPEIEQLDNIFQKLTEILEED